MGELGLDKRIESVRLFEHEKQPQFVPIILTQLFAVCGEARLSQVSIQVQPPSDNHLRVLFCAGMMKLPAMTDLKSVEIESRAGWNPASRTISRW